MPETIVLKVLLHCDGCVAKVKRHLKRLDGVDAFHVDQKNQKVTVFGNLNPQVVLEKVRGAGKTAEFWPLPAELAAKEVGGGKKKGGGGGNNAKMEKSKANKESEEIIEMDEFGNENEGANGEIVHKVHTPIAVDEDADDNALMEKTPSSTPKSVRRALRRV